MIRVYTPETALNPVTWFNNKFPILEDIYGSPVQLDIKKVGNEEIEVVKDLNESYMAGILGENGNKSEPLVYVSKENCFYQYNPNEGIYVGRRDHDLLAVLSALFLNCARDCQKTCDTKALEFRLRDSASLSGIIKHAKGILSKGSDYFSSQLTEYLPCKNGMLRLSDNELLGFSPTYRRRNKLGVKYEPAATCPLFIETLMNEALDLDDQDLLQRWCGLALIGVNLAQRIMILSGTAGGGKGTFIRVLAGIIGQSNVGTLRPRLLLDRFELGRHIGKTLLYGADVPEDFLNQNGASALKSLTGGDPMTIELKSSNEIPDIIGQFNVITTSNSRLTVRLEGDVEAWRRRLAIINYNKDKPIQPIADLSEQILEKEGSGVLNWMLAGLANLRRNGWRLELNHTQQYRVDDLLLESESLDVFIDDCLMRDTKSEMTLSECFNHYTNYCNDRGWVALTRNKFGAQIISPMLQKMRVSTRNDIRDDAGKSQKGWKGIKFIGVPQPPHFIEPR